MRAARASNGPSSGKPMTIASAPVPAFFGANFITGADSPGT